MRFVSPCFFRENVRTCRSYFLCERYIFMKFYNFVSFGCPRKDTLFKLICECVCVDEVAAGMPGESSSDFLDDAANIPDSGAVLTFGRSLFGNDQEPGKFWIRNDSVVEIACGDQFTAVVAASGRVFMFGSNNYGQLGLGHMKTVNKPSCIKSLKPHKMALAAGGRAHLILASENGRLFSCGLNSDGQLGNGTQDDSCEPREIFLLPDSDETSSELPVVKQLAAGAHHSMVLADDGRVFAWGSNVEGQLGVSDTNFATRPILVASSIARIACGYYHSAFVTVEGKLLLVGDPESVKPEGNGALNDDGHPSQLVPVELPNDEVAVDVACGGNHTLVLTDSGQVYAFGEGQRGQLGLEKIVERVSDPTLVASLRGQKMTRIACGECHSSAVNDRGELFAWGDRGYGKLCEENSSAMSVVATKGAGGDFFFASPARMTWLESLHVSKVACGGMHTIVLARPRQFVEDSEALEVVGGSLRSPPPSKPPSPGPVPPMHLPPMSSSKGSKGSKSDASQAPAPSNGVGNGKHVLGPGPDEKPIPADGGGGGNGVVEDGGGAGDADTTDAAEVPDSSDGVPAKNGCGGGKKGKKAKSHVCVLF